MKRCLRLLILILGIGLTSFKSNTQKKNLAWVTLIAESESAKVCTIKVQYTALESQGLYYPIWFSELSSDTVKLAFEIPKKGVRTVTFIGLEDDNVPYDVELKKNDHCTLTF